MTDTLKEELYPEKKEGSMIKIKLTEEDIKGTDDEIREAAKTCANGSYATTICKKCGSIFTTMISDIKTAKIVNECRSCFVYKEK